MAAVVDQAEEGLYADKTLFILPPPVLIKSPTPSVSKQVPGDSACSLSPSSCQEGGWKMMEGEDVWHRGSLH